MSKKKQKEKKPLVKRVEHDLEDSASYANLPNDERTYELPDGTKVTAREWKQQFDNEYYEGSRFGKRRIIKDKEMMKKDYRRNNAAYKLDALSVAEKTGSLVELSNSHEEFMVEASDEWTWQDAYKQYGLEKATELIYAQAMRDLDNELIDKKTTLTRFYLKLTKLKSTNRRRKGQNEGT